jgi:lysophospholipase L1-like esterase
MSLAQILARAFAPALWLALACHPAPEPVPPAAPPPPPRSEAIRATDSRVRVMGRAQQTPDGSVRFGYPGVTLRLAFEGTGLSWLASSNTGKSRVALSIDGAAPRTLQLAAGTHEDVLAENLSPGPHTLEIVHRTETWQGIVSVSGFLLQPPAGASWLTPEPFPDRRLLIIGDSVTSGEGVERFAECSHDQARGANATDSYGVRLARALGAQVHLISYGGRGLLRDWQGKRDVLNAPQFFDLVIPQDNPRVLWNHALYRPDAVLVSLGTNDFNLALRSAPKRQEFVAAYVAFVRKIRGVYPDAFIFLTEGAMVNDAANPKRAQKTTLQTYITDTVERLKKLGDTRVQALVSRHYPGDACDAHPTAEQHALMAEELRAPIATALGW